MAPSRALGKTAPAFQAPSFFADDPVAHDYRTFFDLLHFDHIPERDERRPWPGSPPHPERAYVKALLVKVREGFRYTTKLREFLVKHPPLVVQLGFRPVVDPTQPYGFNVEQTVPCDRHLRHKLQTLPHALLQTVLEGTVQDLKAEIPELGESVAMDVKHIYAWVKENNPRQFVKERFDPHRQPKGDPDCKLGVKRSHNQERVSETPTPAVRADKPATSSAKKEQKEFLWGYGTGIAVARHPTYGECVLAEQTQTFNRHDSTYYFPLIRQARERLQRPIRRFAADAAFDAWYIYEDIHAGGGKAYIPLNNHGFALPTFGPSGHSLCPDGREMVESYRYFDQTRGYHAQVERCPLLTPPGATGETCRIEHPQFVKEIGCVKYRNIERGAQLRLELDRQSAEYDKAYDDRTSAERINSQAKEHGIERPALRRISGVCNWNTLIYSVINAKALQRVRKMKVQQEHTPP